MSAERAVQRRGKPNPQNIITHLFKVMARKLASHPDPFAILVQQVGDGHECAGEKREQGARPANPEVAIRGPGEQGESRAEHGTDEVVSG